MIDSVLFFKVSFDSLSFDEGRYVNILKDYNAYYTSRQEIIQTYMAPGNQLKLYPYLEQNGVYFFSDTNYHNITFIAKDFYGNQAKQNIVVRSEKPSSNEVITKANNLPLYRYGLKYHFEAKNLVVDFPDDALYDSIYFDYRLLKGTKQTHTDIHHLHDASVPIHSYVSLKIKPEDVRLKTDSSKLTIARLVKKLFPICEKQMGGWISVGKGSQLRRLLYCG